MEYSVSPSRTTCTGPPPPCPPAPSTETGGGRVAVPAGRGSGRRVHVALGGAHAPSARAESTSPLANQPDILRTLQRARATRQDSTRPALWETPCPEGRRTPASPHGVALLRTRPRAAPARDRPPRFRGDPRRPRPPPRPLRPERCHGGAGAPARPSRRLGEARSGGRVRRSRSRGPSAPAGAGARPAGRGAHGGPDPRGGAGGGEAPHLAAHHQPRPAHGPRPTPLRVGSGQPRPPLVWAMGSPPPPARGTAAHGRRSREHRRGRRRASLDRARAHRLHPRGPRRPRLLR